MIIKAVKVRQGGMKVKNLHQPDPEIYSSTSCLEKQGWGIKTLSQTHNRFCFGGLVSFPLPSSETKSKGIKFICAGCNWFKSLSPCTFYPDIELQPVKYSHHYLCDNNNHKHFLSHTLILFVCIITLNKKCPTSPKFSPILKTGYEKHQDLWQVFSAQPKNSVVTCCWKIRCSMGGSRN